MAGKSAGLLTGDVGTLTVRTLATNPAIADIRPGTRITVGIGAQTWWTGNVRTKHLGLAADPLGRTREWVTITATDAVSRLAAVTVPALPSTLKIGQVYGDLCDEPDPRTDPQFGRVPSRFARILEWLPDLQWTKLPARGPLHYSYTGAVTQYGAIGEPMTAAEAMDMSCATIRALWWVTADGEIRIAEDDRAAEPIDLLTDEPGGLSYIAVGAAIGPDDIVSRVKLTTRQLEPGVVSPAGTPEVIEYWWEWADPTLLATWGDHRLDLTIGVDAMGGYEHELGAWYARPWYTPPSSSDAMRVASITVADSPAYDVGDILTITNTGRTVTSRIRGITRTVQADRRGPRITTTIALAERA
jgi:hypothetical protein